MFESVRFPHMIYHRRWCPGLNCWILMRMNQLCSDLESSVAARQQIVECHDYSLLLMTVWCCWSSNHLNVLVCDDSIAKRHVSHFLVFPFNWRDYVVIKNWQRPHQLHGDTLLSECLFQWQWRLANMALETVGHPRGAVDEEAVGANTFFWWRSLQGTLNFLKTHARLCYFVIHIFSFFMNWLALVHLVSGDLYY